MTRHLRPLSVHEFRVDNEGHYLGDNGTLGWNLAPWTYQCVNVIGCFLQEGGIPQLNGDADTLNYSQYGRWVANGPTNAPRAGDFVVFKGGRYSSETGHIALCLHGSDDRIMHLFWQNEPDGSPCQATWVNYDNCLGWWRIEWAKNGVELK